MSSSAAAGAAPPERAGRREWIGLAVLALPCLLYGTAVYRPKMDDAVPARVPSSVADTARDTLGGATDVAAGRPDAIGAPLLDAAGEAFTAGLQAAALTAAIVIAALAATAALVLRHVSAPPREQA